MNRSMVVTVWAIMLILAGVVSVLSNLNPASLGGRGSEMDLETLKTQLVKEAEVRAIPREDVEEMWTKLELFFYEVQRIGTSPAARLNAWGTLLFGVAAVIAGAGVLCRQSWARGVTIGVAGGALGLTLVCLLNGFLWELYRVVYRYVWDALPFGIPRAFQALVVVMLWLSLLVPLGWNILTLWFFTRPGVKAQFQKG
jgi:hypothetical protein